MGAGGQRHVPPALPPEKTLYPLYRRLGGPQGRPGQVQRTSISPEFDPRTVQPVTSRYIGPLSPALPDRTHTNTEKVCSRNCRCGTPGNITDGEESTPQ